jgi:hypothetical protein
MRRRIGLVLASLLTVLALASGGWLLDPAGSREATERMTPAVSTVSGEELFQSVADRMVTEGSTTYTFSGSTGGGETRSGSGVMRFSGLRNGLPAFSAQVSMSSPTGGMVRGVLLPDAFYLALPPAKGLPKSKPWLKVSPTPRTSLGRELRPVAEALRANFDPAQSLCLLRAADQVEEVGRDTVEGVPTTRHRATVRLRHAMQITADSALREQYNAMLTAGVRTIEYDIWIDDGGLPRRVRADVPTATSLFSVTGVFRRWGDPVRIAAPSPKHVFDSDRITG